MNYKSMYKYELADAAGVTSVVPPPTTSPATSTKVIVSVYGDR